MAEAKLVKVAHDPLGPTMKAVDGIDGGRTHVDVGLANIVELTKLDVKVDVTELVLGRVGVALVELLPVGAEELTVAVSEELAIVIELIELDVEVDVIELVLDRVEVALVELLPAGAEELTVAILEELANADELVDV
jgi:hypothetical protein